MFRLSPLSPRRELVSEICADFGMPSESNLLTYLSTRQSENDALIFPLAIVPNERSYTLCW